MSARGTQTRSRRQETIVSTVTRPTRDIVGVIPAAGRGTRIAPLPCSKELYPVSFAPWARADEPRPKVVTHYLLDQFRAAGITTIFLVVREGKWDIPAYFLDGALLRLQVAYLVITGSCGPPETIDRAYAFLKDKDVAFGFPDILASPTTVFQRLRTHLASTGADVVLSLYHPDDCRAMDMIDVDEGGRVHAITLKPSRTRLSYCWLSAVWAPPFTEYLHEYLQRPRVRSTARRNIDASGDLPMGAVLQAAVREGLRVDAVRFPTGRYLDIGTPENLKKAVRWSARP